MAKGSHSFKKSTVRRWTLSYLLATLIPLFLVAAASLATLYKNSSFITYSNNITASFVQSSFRDVLSRINEIKAEIIVDTDFEDIRNLENLDDISSLDLFYATSDIRRLEQTSTTVNSLFLFSPTGDWFITNQIWGRLSHMAEDFSLSFSQKEIDDIMSEEIWDVKILEASEGQVLILMPVSFIKSLNPNNLSVGVLVSKNQLFPSVIDEFHDVVIYNEKSNSPIYSLSGKIDEAFFREVDLDKEKDVGKFVVSAAEEPIMSLNCIVLMDKGTYFHDYYMTIQLILLIMLMAIAFGLVLTLRIVKNDWSRFEAAAAASGVDLEMIPSEGGEYAPFVSSVSDLKAQKEELSDMVSRQKKTILESAFRKLLDGDTTVTEETLSALGVDLISPYFYVVIAESEESDVSSYLQTISGKKNVFSFRSDLGEAFIINASDEEDSFYDSLLERAEKDGWLSSLSLSLLHKGLESIHDSYLEAISVHEYQKDHGIPFLSYSKLLSTTRQNTYQFTLEENMVLQKAIKEGNGEETKALINRIIDRNRKNGVSPKMLRYLLFNISGTIIRTINSLDVRFTEAIPEISFPPIIQSQNFQKSLSGVMEIVDSICYSIKAINDSTTDQSSETYQVYRKVLDYIHGNYGDSMMNVSSIADSFHISIAYLSRIFKKYHGINISEYITSYRLDCAKSLLSEGKMVGEVVEECGFGSLRTFLRVFKSVEGITPGQYKSTVVKER